MDYFTYRLNLIPVFPNEGDTSNYQLSITLFIISSACFHTVCRPSFSKKIKSLTRDGIVTSQTNRRRIIDNAASMTLKLSRTKPRNSLDFLFFALVLSYRFQMLRPCNYYLKSTFFYLLHVLTSDVVSLLAFTPILKLFFHVFIVCSI